MLIKSVIALIPPNNARFFWKEMGIREVIGGILVLVNYMVCQNETSQERIKTVCAKIREKSLKE